MIEFKKENKDKVVIKYERTKKVQNLTLYFISVSALLILSLISFLTITPKNQNYYLNAGALALVIILVLLPIKRGIIPVKENYSNRYVGISVVVSILLINDYFNNDVNYSVELAYSGLSLSVFTTFNILSVDRKLLSDSKKIIYSNIPHRIR